jgi:hypothetical protein
VLVLLVLMVLAVGVMLLLLNRGVIALRPLLLAAVRALFRSSDE